jgi:hypothetical protein
LAQGIHIQFAHRTFSWSNEARGKAAVHCVIVGFGLQDLANKTIYEYEDIKGEPLAVPAANINPYLVNAYDFVISKRRTPICLVSEISYGSMANDDGHLILDTETKNDVLQREPNLAPYIREFVGAYEFLNNDKRWCFWLKDAAPVVMRSSPEIRKRIEAVRAFRSASNRQTTKELAATPTLFGEDRQPTTSYLLLPKVSSENRVYIPLGFLGPEVIANGSSLLITGATLHELGVLQSQMHMTWMRQVCGRLESRYQYSAQIVYNNFPWPGFAGEPLSDKHRTAIEQAAQCVLDARDQFTGASLADLYDPLTMPPALYKAHQKLDTAVDAAYQPSGGKKTYATDADRVAFLFDLYQRITSLLPAVAVKKTRSAEFKEN